VEAAWRLATCEVELGDAPAARALLEKLIKEHPHITVALVELAKIELDDGNTDRAHELLADAVGRAPMNDAAQYNLSLVLDRLGHSDEAAEHMARSRELQEWRRQLASAMERVNADADDVAARCEAAELCIQLRELQQAANLLTAVLARDPQNEQAKEVAKKLNESANPAANDAKE
jgi:predicted Zn-dependent protease